MKNLNEQSDRIKQLFTEERLHGNLVDSEEEILSEQEKTRVADKTQKQLDKQGKRKDRKLKNANTPEKMDKAREKYTKKTGKINDNQYGNFKNYKKIKAAWKNKDSGFNLYAHKDDSDEAKNYFVVASPNKKAKDQDIKKFVNQYFQHQRTGELLTNVETLKTGQATNADGDYTVYRYYVKTTIGKRGEHGDDLDAMIAGGGEQSTAAPTDTKTTASPTDTKTTAAPTAAAPTDTKTKTQPTAAPTQKGDFTAALTQIGGSQEGFTYVSNGDGTADKLKDGKKVAHYVRESKINKMSLFESVMDFDIDKAIVENWNWVKADGTKVPFKDKLSANFDKAIGQISGGETPSTPAIDGIEPPTPETNTNRIPGQEEKEYDKKHPKIGNQTTDKVETEPWWKNQPIEKDIDLLDRTWKSDWVSADEFKNVTGIVEKYKSNICEFATKHKELTNMSLKDGINSVSFTNLAANKSKKNMLSMISGCNDEQTATTQPEPEKQTQKTDSTKTKGDPSNWSKV